MRYSVTVKGDQPEGGYPLYIALHGGGSADTPDFNDEQWEDMMRYYCDELDCGVYIAVRERKSILMRSAMSSADTACEDNDI